MRLGQLRFFILKFGDPKPSNSLSFKRFLVLPSKHASHLSPLILTFQDESNSHEGTMAKGKRILKSFRKAFRRLFCVAPKLPRHANNAEPKTTLREDQDNASRTMEPNPNTIPYDNLRHVFPFLNVNRYVQLICIRHAQVRRSDLSTLPFWLSESEAEIVLTDILAQRLNTMSNTNISETKHSTSSIPP